MFGLDNSKNPPALKKLKPIKLIAFDHKYEVWIWDKHLQRTEKGNKGEKYWYIINGRLPEVQKSSVDTEAMIEWSLWRERMEGVCVSFWRVPGLGQLGPVRLGLAQALLLSHHRHRYLFRHGNTTIPEKLLMWTWSDMTQDLEWQATIRFHQSWNGTEGRLDPWLFQYFNFSVLVTSTVLFALFNALSQWLKDVEMPLPQYCLDSQHVSGPDF